MARIGFFFSYASRDHSTAWRDDDGSGKQINLLDRFFEHLRNVVTSKLGLPEDRVSFRDTSRLQTGDIWPDALTDGLNQCQTLIAVISPFYLKSENCGRELKFILDRYEMLRMANPLEAKTHRVIPVFWENAADCESLWPSSLRAVRDDIQFKTDREMPQNYPAKGLRRLILLSSLAERERLCEALAERIVTHFKGAPLPIHPDPKPFTQLPTVLGAAAGSDDLSALSVGNGPGVAQVVYVVGDRSDLDTIACPKANQYPDHAVEWEPFPDAPGATISAATEEGVRRVGNTAYKNWGWPRELLNMLGTARDRNSVVLFVLDRWSVRCPRFERALREYADTNFANTGLVTAGGPDIPDEEMEEVFGNKFRDRHRYHDWTVPTQRNEYVTTVSTVISAIKRDLMRYGRRPATFPPSPRPTLNTPHEGAS